MKTHTEKFTLFTPKEIFDVENRHVCEISQNDVICPFGEMSHF